MRAVVLLLLAAGVVWAVFRFDLVGTGDVEAEEPTGSVFLDPIVPDVPPPAPAFAEAGPAAGQRPTLGGGASPFAGAAALGDDGVQLAALVLHGDPDEVDGFLRTRGQNLGSTLGRAAQAFSLARSGNVAEASRVAGDLDTLEDLDEDTRALLAFSLGEGEVRPSLRGRPSPLVLAMSMALNEYAAADAARNGRWDAAARGYSALLLEELDAPWPADREALRAWSEELHRAQAQYRWNPRANWPRIELEVQPGDSLTAIRKRVVAENPGLLVCTGLIERASGYPDGYLLQPGDPLLVPTDPISTLVDLDARWMLYLMGDEVVGSWEVAIGAPDSPTTPGIYEVGEKQRDPTWWPTGQEPVVFGDPRNPLGTRWITWIAREGGGRRLGFHGTKEPDTVGTMASDGCVRLVNSEVEELYRILPMGTRIEVR